MIKSFYCFAIIAISCAKAQQQEHHGYDYPKVLKYESFNDGLGSYAFEFDTSDGTHRDEKGDLKDKGTEDETMVVHGSYYYTGADGVVYTVKYMADENGFHPEGDHFTVPAFVPWLKGQPHDDGHYRHEQSSIDNRHYQPQVDLNLPSNADNREVNIMVTPKYIPALKKRNLETKELTNGDDADGDDVQEAQLTETKSNLDKIVADINKLV